MDVYLILTADFTTINQTLTFTVGYTIGAQLCGFVNITDDTTVENNETFLATFTSTDPAVEFLSGEPLQSIITIIDNDGKLMSKLLLIFLNFYCCFLFPQVVTVQWQLQAYNTSEESGSVNVCAVLSEPTERNISFMISTSSETASGKHKVLSGGT